MKYNRVIRLQGNLIPVRLKTFADDNLNLKVSTITEFRQSIMLNH